MLPSDNAKYLNGKPITDAAVDSAALVYSDADGGYVHSIVLTGAHAASHITGGSDEVDGDKLDIDWNPSNTTPATAVGYSTSVDNLTSHLKGIDTTIGTLNAHNHASLYSAITHDHDSDYSATTHDHDSDYSATTHDHDLDYSALDHDATHIDGGTDEIDADKLSITWAPTGYTRSVISEVTTDETQLSSHLYGIDAVCSAYLAHDHDADYSDILHDHSSDYADIDGDVLALTWVPTYYTPETVSGYSTGTGELTSHLKGIDNYLATTNGDGPGIFERIAAWNMVFSSNLWI